MLASVSWKKAKRGSNRVFFNSAQAGSFVSPFPDNHLSFKIARLWYPIFSPSETYSRFYTLLFISPF